MNKFSFLRNNRLIFAWFISYILILLFIVFMNFMAYFQIESNMADQNNRYAAELLENKKNKIDSARQVVGNVATELAGNSDINRVATALTTAAGKDYADIMTARRALSVYKSIESEVTDIYVYFHSLDYCISFETCNDANTFYNVHVKETNFPQAEWVKLMKGYHHGEFVAAPAIEGESSVVLYLLSVYEADRFKPYATIAIEMDSSSLILASSGDNFQRAFYIVDEKGQIFLSDNGDAQKKKQVQALLDEHGIANGITAAGNMVMLAAESENSSWSYLYLLDKSEFGSIVSTARRNIVLFNLIGVLVAALIAFAISRKNYRPVEKIVSIFGNAEEVTGQEFHFIESKIADIIEKNRTYGEMAERLQDTTVRGAFLSRLLTAKMPVGNRQEILQSLGISFPRPYFLVALYYIEIGSEMFFDRQNDDVDEAYRLARLVLTNVMGDLLSDDYYTEYCDVDGMVGCVVNLKSPGAAQEYIAAAKRLQEVMRDSFNIAFMAGLSEVYGDLSSLPEAYSEAMTCVEQHFFHARDIVQYHELEQTDMTNVYISKATEEQLSEGIAMGNMEVCQSVLARIFEDSISNSGKSVQAVRCMLYQLTAIVIKTIAETGTLENEDFSTLVGMIEHVGVDVDVQQIRAQFTGALQRFCDRRAGRQVQKTDVLAEKAKAYVEEYYQNFDLTVAMIAEHCHVSMAYLSTNFKRKYQVGLLEYINYVRIEHAKGILSATDHTVERVAEMVGCANLRSFFRLFSRYVGISPNKYRAMILSKEKEN